MWFIGIDFSKASLDAAGLSEGGEVRRIKVAHSGSGHAELIGWLRDAPCSYIALEATATYHRAVVAALAEAAMSVSVLNPAQVSHFVKSQQRRNKTDTADAMWLAVYARERRPPATMPMSFHEQSLAREIYALDKDLTRLKNRLGAAQAGGVHPDVITSLQRRIQLLQDEKRALEEQLERDVQTGHPDELALLTSIPGIAKRSACLLLAEFQDVRRFSSARKLVAFAGLTPSQFESGSTVHRYTRISRMGSSAIRRILYMPCLSAIQHNGVIRSFFNKLVERGKPRKAAVVACMAKLLKIIYGVLIHRHPFTHQPASA